MAASLILYFDPGVKQQAGRIAKSWEAKLGLWVLPG